MKLTVILSLLMLAAFPSFSQVGTHRISQVLSRGSNVSANVVPYASIRVCVAGTNCATMQPIYSNIGLTISALNPVTADANGNYSYYVAAGCYDEQISGAGMTTYLIYNVCFNASGSVPPASLPFLGSNSSNTIIPAPYTPLNPANNLSDVGSAATALGNLGGFPKVGGTLTGPLVLPSNPTTNFQAATKQYVDTGVASAVPLAGGTMTGPLNSATDVFSTGGYIDFRSPQCGGVADVLALTGTGSIAVSSSTLTMTASNFTTANVAGKTIVIAGAGAAVNGSTALIATVASYVSATQVTLSTAATTAVSGASVWMFTDNTAALAACATYAEASNLNIKLPSAAPPYLGYGVSHSVQLGAVGAQGGFAIKGDSSQGVGSIRSVIYHALVEPYAVLDMSACSHCGIDGIAVLPMGKNYSNSQAQAGVLFGSWTNQPVGNNFVLNSFVEAGNTATSGGVIWGSASDVGRVDNSAISSNAGVGLELGGIGQSSSTLTSKFGTLGGGYGCTLETLSNSSISSSGTVAPLQLTACDAMKTYGLDYAVKESPSTATHIVELGYGSTLSNAYDLGALRTEDQSGVSTPTDALYLEQDVAIYADIGMWAANAATGSYTIGGCSGCSLTGRIRATNGYSGASGYLNIAAPVNNLTLDLPGGTLGSINGSVNNLRVSGLTDTIANTLSSISGYVYASTFCSSVQQFSGADSYCYNTADLITPTGNVNALATGAWLDPQPAGFVTYYNPSGTVTPCHVSYGLYHSYSSISVIDFALGLMTDTGCTQTVNLDLSHMPTGSKVTMPSGQALTSTSTLVTTLGSGFATLAAGTVTITNAAACAVSSSCLYSLTNCGTGGTVGTLSVGTITAGTSFVINSSSSTDTSKVCWAIRAN